MRWLVVGASGMLGRDLVPLLRARGHEVRGLGRAELDVTDVAATSLIASGIEPDDLGDVNPLTATEPVPPEPASVEPEPGPEPEPESEPDVQNSHSSDVHNLATAPVEDGDAQQEEES